MATIQASAPAADGNIWVVRSGDTLWSIATRLLGDGATSAQIAAEVDRCLKLNAGTLRSGDADLIFAGERLRL